MCKQDFLFLTYWKEQKAKHQLAEGPTQTTFSHFIDVNSLTLYDFLFWPQKNKALASFCFDKDHSPTEARLAEVQRKEKTELLRAFFLGVVTKGVRTRTHAYMLLLSPR